MISLMVLTLAVATAPGAGAVAQASPATAPAATPLPVEVPSASPAPAGITMPASTQGLVIPPVPDIQPAFRPPAHPQLPSGDIVGTAGPFVGLALNDAIAMALAHNTDLAVAQSNRRIAQFQIVAAQGAYDLRFQVQPSYSYQATPAVNALQAGPGFAAVDQTTFGSSASLQAQTTSGGTVTLGTSAQRVDNNALFDSYDPYYQTSMSLMFDQPLLRGRGTDATRRQIALSRISAQQSSDNILLGASNALANVLDAYYNLVYAWKNVAIQEDALRQVKAQSESNERLVRRGAAAPVDVVESNTQVNAFQDNVYAAIQQVAMYQNQLKQLLLSDPADPIWTANLVPVSPVIEEPPEPTVSDVVVTALKERPEVAQLRDQIRSQDVNVAYQKDQTKPQVDLNFNITEQGFAGRAAPNVFGSLFAPEVNSINQLIGLANMNLPPGTMPLVPITLPTFPLPGYNVGGIGQAYTNMLAGRYPEVSIGATIGFPLRNRTAEANYKAALEQRAQLQVQEVALVQRLQVEARNAVQAYRSARSRLIAATAARQAAEQVAASELRKFHAGQSTTFLVLQRQTDLATQRGRELLAETALEQALVQLDQASGNILQRYDVDATALGNGTLGKTPALVP